MTLLAQSPRRVLLAILLCAGLAILQVRAVAAQSDPEIPFESKFIDAHGLRLHYLDFGGAGIALVFVHSESRDAFTYAEFATHFSDSNRVFAVTRSGYGHSEDPGHGYDVPSQAARLIDFLDALGIQRAVFAGNSAPGSEMTYLAEHHADRVAGLIYLAGPPSFGAERVIDADPTKAGTMLDRAWYDAAQRARRKIRHEYRPDYLRPGQLTLEVPTLTFVDRRGAGNGWGVSIALVLAGSPLVGDAINDPGFSIQPAHFRRMIADEAYRYAQLDLIADKDARAYFRRLAEDAEFQADVQRHHQQVILPAILASQDKFKQAFGNKIDVVELDVPLVTGYAYRDSPELILPHIQLFLGKIYGRESGQ